MTTTPQDVIQRLRDLINIHGIGTRENREAPERCALVTSVAKDAIAALTTAESDLAAARKALETAIKVADEAAREWDAAPQGMKAGKLLLALCGHIKGYRPDIDSIHAALQPKGT